MDVVIPIVFPDYKIRVNVPRYKVDILPWFDFDNFSTPKLSQKLSYLGHAGVLFINGKNGITKYYEYGRYDAENLGLVVKAKNLPDALVVNNRVDLGSLKRPLSFISRVSGQSGRIEGAYIEVEGKYQAMLEYAEGRKKQNNNPNRKPYELDSYSCIHFAKETVEKAGVDTPIMIDPRPNSYIGELRDDFLDLDYTYNKLTIESRGVY
ncbi:hypothetical protein ACJJIK_07235 [Microbulbifer sp. ZKSA006]|uniref:hypothetical protein n=1 Tax=Microbulbifer sp. ZKSA006 TaxID=3243390 RepID=UPI004039B8B2